MKPDSAPVLVSGREIYLTNLTKIMWPGPDCHTKADYLDYLQKIGPHILEHLKDRPVVLTRYPDGLNGKAFYQKDRPHHAPPWVTVYRHWSRESSRFIDYVICNDLATLIWLGNLAALEIHTWLSSTLHPGHPDYVVFDLDPAPPAGWREACQAAHSIREALRTLGLQGYPKTSGATGIHIYVPITPLCTHQQVTAFAKALGSLLMRHLPDLVTLERSVNKRRGRVYIDYLQNAPGKTMVAPYSPRALPGAPVSFPLKWSDLDAADPCEFTIVSVPRLLAQHGDHFSGILQERQDIRPAMEALGCIST